MRRLTLGRGRRCALLGLLLLAARCSGFAVPPARRGGDARPLRCAAALESGAPGEKALGGLEDGGAGVAPDGAAGEALPAAGEGDLFGSMSELSRKVEASLMSQYDERVPAPPPQARRALAVNLDLLNHVAREARRRGDYGEAVRTWQRCLRIDPHDGRAWLALARLAERRRSFDKAERLYQEGIRFCPESPYLLQAYGAYHERRGDLSNALRLYALGARSDRDHCASWVALGKLLSRLGDDAAADACLARAVEADGAGYVAWHARACHLWDRMGDEPGGRAAFEASLRLNPSNAATFQAWGAREAQSGNLAEAAALFERGDEAYRGNTYLLTAWALLEAKRGDEERAVALFERALRRAEDLLTRSRVRDGAVWQAYGAFLRSVGDLDGARRLFARGTEAAPRHLPTYNAWACAEAAEGRVEEARRIYELGLRRAPGAPGAARSWMLWALLEAGEGKPQRARRLLRLGASADAADRGVAAALALLEEREGDAGAAREAWEAAVAVRGRDRALWKAYAAFEERAGDAVRAERLRERADAAMEEREGAAEQRALRLGEGAGGAAVLSALAEKRKGAREEAGAEALLRADRGGGDNALLDDLSAADERLLWGNVVL